MGNNTPHIVFAIVDSNMLSALGLKQILRDIAPMVDAKIFITFSELESSEKSFVHYFVSSAIYLENRSFFQSHLHRTIVIVNGEMQIQNVPTLNVCQSENMIIKSLLQLQKRGHPTLPPKPSTNRSHILSPREIEVTILLTKGYINKEIAAELDISTTTVITHRKNIMEKLQARSISDIIIFAVTNGLVSIGEL